MNSSRGTVLLGMSGGVDSSVAALLLQKQGYKVIGVFLKLYSDTKNPLTRECSWIAEREMALRIAAKLDIELITLDYESVYKKQVIAPLFRAYALGLTPNPDLACNSLLKFPVLWTLAQKKGAQFIATGHYVRIRKSSSGFQLLAGKDAEKDQSYFLAGLSQKDLSHTLFPLGNLTKKEVRAIAKRHRFPNWEKHGTVGICFVGQKNMHQFLGQKIRKKSGIVTLPDGTSLGTHEGTAFYTLGQKAGEREGIVMRKPRGLESARWYVAAKDARKNVLVVAPEGHPSLLQKQVHLTKMHSINPREALPVKLHARIRHLGDLHAGILRKVRGAWTFTFQKPQSGLAPGQFLVLYRGERVVACGEMRL